MELFSSSPILLNAVIKTKVKQTFLFGSDTHFQVDKQWLELVTDTLIYTFNAKKKSVNEVIDLEDDDLVNECVEAMVIQICQLIEQGIPKVKSIGKFS